MTHQKRAVTVLELPEELSMKAGRGLFREVSRCMNVDRPYLVFDFSKVRQLDNSVVLFLLCCLEVAMKRNGDIKLASLPATPTSILDATGIPRLFTAFDTAAEAVNSYHELPFEAAQSCVPENFYREIENSQTQLSAS